MIPQLAPTPVRYRHDPLWERTKQFTELVGLLLNDPGARLPVELDDAQRIAVEAEAASRKWRIFTRDDYRKALEWAMNETRRWVVAPVSDAPTEDVAQALRQPEGRSFWRRVIEGAGATRALAPSLHCSLGVMLALGGMRMTPHLRQAYDLTIHNRDFWQLVSDLALSCEGPAQCEPTIISYSQVTRHLPRLSEGLAGEAHVTLAEIAAKFSSWGIPVGRYLAVDGSLVPAWAQQRSAWVNGVYDPALEQRLRRHTPEARYITYSREYEEEDSHRVDRRAPQRVRGYRLCLIVDLATGLTLAFALPEATAHEPKILREVLLPAIFRASPNLDVTAIVGDAKYDDGPTHEYLETHYGIHPVAIRHIDALRRRHVELSESDHPSIAVVHGDGLAECRAHRHPLEYRSLEPPPGHRAGLQPGEPTNVAAWRVRYYCADGCGKVSIAAEACHWDNVPYIPRTPYGRLKLYALGRALAHRRNQVEATLSAQQVGYKQGLDGAARTRLYDRTVNEGVFGITVTTRGLLALAAERELRGEGA